MRFLIKQKFLQLGDLFYIKDQNGRNRYSVKGKFLTARKKLKMFSMAGNEVLSIRQLWSVVPKYEILQQGRRVAVIKRKAPFLITKKYLINSQVYGNLRITGNIFAWDFSIVKDNGEVVGAVSKKIFNVIDTYVVDVFSRQYEALVLGLSIIMDAIHHKAH